MNLTIPPVGKLAFLSIIFTLVLLISWTIVVLSNNRQYTKSSISDASRFRFGEHADMNKLPRLSPDKHTLVITSEDALPNAFEFLRLNMYLPIQKIVLMKSGLNDTVRVYPIPREGMIGLGRDNLSLSFSEIGLIALFLIFIIGSFAYIFISMSSSRVYWDDDSWINNEDICLDSHELCGEDDEDDEILLKAEKKRKDIEEI